MPPNAKQAVLEIVEGLPSDASTEDIMAELYFRLRRESNGRSAGRKSNARRRRQSVLHARQCLNPHQSKTPSRLGIQLLLAFGYLAMVAEGISWATERSYLPVLAMVAFGAFALSGLALLWFALWAFSKNGRPGQFGIGSMMFLTVFVAVFFGVIRWLVDNSDFLGREEQGIETFLGMGFLCLAVTAVAIPFLLFMTESLLWASVWLVRRSSVQQWLARKRGE